MCVGVLYCLCVCVYCVCVACVSVCDKYVCLVCVFVRVTASVYVSLCDRERERESRMSVVLQGNKCLTSYPHRGCRSQREGDVIKGPLHLPGRKIPGQ